MNRFGYASCIMRRPPLTSGSKFRYYCVYRSCTDSSIDNADMDNKHFHADDLQDMFDHIHVTHCGLQFKCDCCKSFWPTKIEYMKHLSLCHNVEEEQSSSLLKPQMTSKQQFESLHFFYDNVEQIEHDSQETQIPVTEVGVISTYPGSVDHHDQPSTSSISQSWTTESETGTTTTSFFAQRRYEETERLRRAAIISERMKNESEAKKKCEREILAKLVQERRDRRKQ